MRVQIRSRCAALLWLSVGICAVQAGTAALRVEQAWAPPTPPGAAVAAVYLSIVNGGANADSLTSADSPMAGKVAMHESRIVDGMMQMRDVTAVACPPHAVTRSEPGGLHLMLSGLTHSLQTGAVFPLTLHFRDAGTVVIDVAVRPAA